MDGLKTFTETAVWEAATRRTRVDLVLDPITPRTDSRLISRLLGLDDEGNLVLDVPRTSQDKKVFVPAGWQVGLAFELADLWMQSRSVVVGHCHYHIHSTRRIDALTVERPPRIVSCNRRRNPRQEVEPFRSVSAAILATYGPDGQGPLPSHLVGRLRNWSEDGMGLEFIESHDLVPNCQLVIQVRIPALERASLFRGVVKHVTSLAPGLSLVGIGDIEEVAIPAAAPQGEEAQSEVPLD